MKIAYPTLPVGAYAEHQPLTPFDNAHGDPIDGSNYHCPCCGYPTLKTRGGFEICPICYWEDDGQDDHDVLAVRGGPNYELSLSSARKNFREIGACEAGMIRHVRPPTKEEIQHRMTHDVSIRREGGAGHIRLNRPAALHALTLDMVHAMTAALLAWCDDPAVQAIIIDHAEGRGFCAGGDIAFLRNSALNDDGDSGRKFFHDEYQLNHLLFTYPKPVVAFMDGITMGGGVGISQPARFRVATENTKLAMPETGIGLFPDVGGGWYLSRLEGRVGQYLALTGARIAGPGCLALGLATHYLPAAALDEAKARIAEDPDRIEGVLGQLSATPPESNIVEQVPLINRLFASDRLEDILAALDADASDWAAKERAMLRTKSPQTCKVALRQLATSLTLPDFAANMVMEYRIASRVLTRPDFAEGVRAVIVDKDNDAKWDPPTPEAVSDALIDLIFAPLGEGREWKPL
ncbi:MAG: enoyl-CoA hydratase/isomerase family protein [Sphingopyxis sp.]|nr:enoyl-CoA hydratase/isomerase family protein [Sphingopyxis sp.]